MTEEKQDAVAVWQPKEFAGNDLLPLENTLPDKIEGVPELVGRENVNPDDLILPSIVLLHGTSEAVTNGVEGAVPGRFMHTGTEECLPEGSLRMILVHHHKGNVLFPKDDERYAGLETCISRDQIEGTTYGACDECKKCYWPEDGGPALNGATSPLGAEVHHFVAMTDRWGPVMIRFSRSSYKAANQFISSWIGSRKNLFAHPVVVRVAQGDKTLPTGKVSKFYHMQMAWQTTERVPAELQQAAYALYKEVSQKHDTGNLTAQDEGAADTDFE